MENLKFVKIKITRNGKERVVLVPEKQKDKWERYFKAEEKIEKAINENPKN